MASQDAEDIINSITTEKKDSIKTENSAPMVGDFKTLWDQISKKLNIKQYIIIFILFFIVNTESFYNSVLKSISGSLDEENHLTNKGIIIQGILLVLGFIFLDILLKSGHL